MYVVNFLFKNSAVQIGFTFKAFKAADDLLKKATVLMVRQAEGQLPPEEQVFLPTDDYDCRAAIDMSCVSGIAINDVDKETKRGAQYEVVRQKEYQTALRTEQQNPANKIVMPATNGNLAGQA